jgi:hypothetical protein
MKFLTRMEAFWIGDTVIPNNRSFYESNASCGWGSGFIKVLLLV